jgi:hypothetical protein
MIKAKGQTTQEIVPLLCHAVLANRVGDKKGTYLCRAVPETTVNTVPLQSSRSKVDFCLSHLILCSRYPSFSLQKDLFGFPFRVNSLLQQ